SRAEFIAKHTVLNDVDPLALEEQRLTPASLFPHAERRREPDHANVGSGRPAVHPVKIQFVEAVRQQRPARGCGYALPPVRAIADQDGELRAAVDERDLLEADVANVRLLLVADRPDHA